MEPTATVSDPRIASRLAGAVARTACRPPFPLEAYAVTFICGMLDAACFLGLGHVFAEIMTGNLVYLAFSLGTTPWRHAAPIGGYVVALATFGVGAMLGGRMLRLGSSSEVQRLGFVVEAAALIAATVLVAVTHPGQTGIPRLAVLACLAFGMGIQNAMFRRWGVSNLATNVMTLTLTGVLADSVLAGGDNPMLGRRITSLLTFFVSAVLGALLLQFGVLCPVAVATGIFVVALPTLLLRPVQPTDTASR